MLILALLAVLAPAIAPYSPTVQNYDAMAAGPSAQHLLGTDDLGRDTLSRLLYGAPASLYASVMAVAIGLALGLPFGLLAGYCGGTVDLVISRIIDTLLSFPGIVLAVGVTGAFGRRRTSLDDRGRHRLLARDRAAHSRPNAGAARRAVRRRSAQLRRRHGRILIRHILPNAAGPVIVQVTLLLAVALLVEASLSFLGLGAQPPSPSWGSMLAEAYGNMETAPGLMYPPGIAILLTALAFNALGGSLRTALDPKLRRAGR